MPSLQSQKSSCPRLMIAALHGRSGKTVITLGLLRALSRSGKKVQAFKKGPDFIDPGWHQIACGRTSRNLDSFFMTPEQIRTIVGENSEACNVSIIEGAMGLYDGLDVEGSSSSAQIAKITNTPVILVVDVTRMTRTAAALVWGCQQFDPEVNIAGVILNRVRGPRQEQLVREAIEQYCKVPVVAALPVDAGLTIPDRHLGLVSSAEAEEREQTLDGIAKVIEEYVDCDALLAIAQKVRPLSFKKSALKHSEREKEAPRIAGVKEAPRIAVVRDAAFCFYYEENLQALKDEGAELLFVNSLEDKALPPDIHALYIGGGFPEEFALQLEANESFKHSVKEAVEAELPVYAECGGLMYLGTSLEYKGLSAKMVGALKLNTRMQEKRQAHGYSIMKSCRDESWLEASAMQDAAIEAKHADVYSSWIQEGTTLIGHEFHHSKVEGLCPKRPLVFCNTRGNGIINKHDGITYKGVLAVYTHVNALASPQWAKQFVAQARRFQEHKNS